MNSIGLQTAGSADKLFEQTAWLTIIKINGYPLMSLLWNVFLLLIPWLALRWLWSLYQKGQFKTWRARWEAAVAFFIWLIFIPNTAYIITDARHLVDPYCQMDLYYRVCPDKAWAIIVFFSYAVIGWLSLVYLIRPMRQLVEKLWHKEAGTVFVIALMPAVALGVLLGLIDRWNSWQLLNAPWAVLQSAGNYFMEPEPLKNWLIFTAALYLLYWVGDRLFIRYDKGVKKKIKGS
jgi:uncharacterized membrane protein